MPKAAGLALVGFVTSGALILIACGTTESTAAQESGDGDASADAESGESRADRPDEPPNSPVVDAGLDAESVAEHEEEAGSPDRDALAEESAGSDAEPDRDPGVVDAAAEPDVEVHRDDGIADAPDGEEAGLPHHIGGSCVTDVNCIAGLTCDLTIPYGRCTRTCVDDVDCGAGNVCASDGTCYRRCALDADCLRTSFHCAGGVPPRTFCISEYQRDL